MSNIEFEDRMQEREWLLEKRVEETLAKIHQLLNADDLTDAESRLGWMRVIEKLVQSVAMERQSDVTREWLGLTQEPKHHG